MSTLLKIYTFHVSSTSVKIILFYNIYCASVNLQSFLYYTGIIPVCHMTIVAKTPSCVFFYNWISHTLPITWAVPTFPFKLLCGTSPSLNHCFTETVLKI